MFVNPSGVQMDALNSVAGGEDFAADWVWESAGRVADDGYVVEIRLPLESIRFKSGPDVRMGLLFFRRVSRLGVSWSWPEMPPGTWVFEAHVPVVFEELRQPLLLEVIPNVTVSRTQSRDERGAWRVPDRKDDAGASVKYGITSAVTLDATVNPDFSQFFLRLIAQLDTSRRCVLGDTLASYELVPGTVVHAGYGSILEAAPGDPYAARARAFFFKASYLARF